MDTIRVRMTTRRTFPVVQGRVLDETWHDAKWVAALAGISCKQVYELVKQGRIPAHKPGERLIRFRESEIVDWIESNRVEPQRNPSPTSAVPSSMPKQRHDKVRAMQRG